MTDHALVVGGNRGIGRAVSLRLARAGWDTSAASVTGAAEVRLAAAADGLSIRSFQVDVRHDASVHRLRTDWDQVSTSLSALLVTAGTAVSGLMSEIEPRDVVRMLDEHIAGAYRMVREFREPLVSGRGHIVLMLSRMGRRAVRYGYAYGTAKAGLAHLAGCLADELADAGVRVNCVSPGSVDTELLRAALPDRIPARTMHPEDVAGVIVQLLGQDFRHVNGTVIDVPGWHHADRMSERARP